MKTLFLFYLFITFLNTIPKKIVIDVSRIDQVNVSEIADKVIVIPLKTNEFIFHSIDRVFLINDNIFILEMFMENGIVYSRVVKFDLSGNFKGQIGERDPVSKEFLRIYDMKYDETNKVIYLVYSDGNRMYDDNGNFLTFYKANGRPPGVRTVQEFIFQNQIWGTEYSSKNGIAYNSFINIDLYGEKKNTIRSFKVEQAKSVTPVFRLASLSIHDKELYFSIGIDNTLYQVKQDKLSPFYKVEFINLPASNINLALSQIMIGTYIKNQYWIKGVSYDFLFNTETSKSFNIIYRNQNGKLTSGVTDDMYNTGFFTINPTNREDYIYFIRQPADIKGSKIYNPGQSNSIIFLVKLK